MTTWFKPGRAMVAALFAIAANGASAQEDISPELGILKAQFMHARAGTLPVRWTGGLEGLSLVFTLDSPLPAELDKLSDAHREAARAICRKVGAAAVEKNRSKPGLETLRFFVVQLKSSDTAFGPVKAVNVKGVVFDTENGCIELR